MRLEPGFFAEFGAFFDLIQSDALINAVQGLLVAGFKAEEHEAEIGFLHQIVAFLVHAVEAHVAAEDRFFIVAALDKKAAEFLHPIPGEHAAGVVEDLFHVIIVYYVLHFGEESFRRKTAVAAAGIDGVVPDAEGALSPPAVPAAVGVGSGSVFEVAVLIGVEPPLRKVPVYEGQGVEVVI